jgi:uncharacterized membrane protein (UPF0127 family)
LEVGVTEKLQRPDVARRAVLATLICATFLWAGGLGEQAVAKKPLKVERLDILTASGPRTFKVELADNEATREYGLMFRRSLAPDHGMLFNFKAVAPVAFWMRNTLIPLDMIFIARDGVIVSIARNAIPHDETPIPSGAPVLAVLEIAGGRAAELGVQPGDKVRYRIFKGG